MEDPALLLREQLASAAPTLLDEAGTPVADLSKATSVRFKDDLILPKTVAAPFSAAGRAFSYDLQVLVYAFLKREEQQASYAASAREEGVAFVSAIDRRAVIDWLSAKTALDAGPGAAAGTAGQGASGAQVRKEAPGAVESPSKKAKYTPNGADQTKVKQLVQLMDGPPYAEGKGDKAGKMFRNRESVLWGDRVNNFESARLLASTRLKHVRADNAAPVAGAPKSSATASASTPGKLAKKKHNNPIILVSPAESAIISMKNVKDFLEGSQFVHAKQYPGKAEETIVVNHTRATASQAGAEPPKAARYFIVDGVEALNKFSSPGTDDAWDRVVCVLTTGQEWQFQNYKWTTAKELFHHVKGFYIQFAKEAVNPKVRQWNVTELRIDETKRHLDKSAAAEFWRVLEAWILMHKPYLSY